MLRYSEKAKNLAATIILTSPCGGSEIIVGITGLKFPESTVRPFCFQIS